jgi:hypothetical protein
MRHLITRSMLLLVTVNAVPAWAQSSAAPVTAGLQAGLTRSTVSPYPSGSPQDAFGSAFRSGASVGGFFVLPMRGTIAFQPELLYVQKGATLTDPQSDSSVARTRLAYLEVPLLVRWTPARREVAPFVIGGATVDRLLSAHVDSSASGGPSDTDVSSQTRSADVGIAAGGGVQIGRGFIQGRFVQGLLDIGNTRRVGGVVHTRTFSVLAGVRF